MKILFVTDLYPLGSENVAKALFYIVEEWINAGHDVEVLRSNFVPNGLIRGKKFKKTKVYYENGVKIYNINCFTPFWFNVYDKLPKYFSLKNYDVVISHMPCGALLANKLLKKEKIKYICAVHSSDITVLKDFKYVIYFRNALKNAYKNADKIAARSPFLQSKIEEIIPETAGKTFVAYSGLQDELIDTKLCSKPFNGNFVRIATVASLIKRKNIDVLIKALAMTADLRFRLIIIGDGKERKKLEKLASSLDVSDRVEFTGNLPREEVIKKLATCDIFALLSKNETFGLVYLEAMLCGNIIIANKYDGIAGILRDGENAFLIPPDEKELCRCLNQIISLKPEETERIKENAINTLKCLNQSAAAEKYINNIK